MLINMIIVFNSNKSRDTAGFINGFFIIYMRVPKNGKKLNHS